METHNDNTFKEKLSNTSVDLDIFDQWDEIEAKLDKRENRKGVLFWWFGGVVMFLVTVLGWGILNYDKVSVADSDISMNIPQLETSNETLLSKKTKNQDTTTSGQEDAPSAVVNTSKSDALSQLSDQGQSFNTKSINNSISKKYQTSKEVSDITRKGAKNEYDSDLAQFSITRLFDAPIVQSNIQRESKIFSNENQGYKTINGINNNSLEDRELLSVSPIDMNINLGIQSMFLGDNIILSVPQNDIIKNNFQKWGIYLDFAISKPNVHYKNAQNDTYGNFLSMTYLALSQVDLGLGMAYSVSSKWDIFGGIDYQQIRSVHRGDVSQVETISETLDSAAVFVNSFAATIYKPGQVTINNTIRTNFQQYSYAHSLGIRLGALWELPYSFYLSGEASYPLILWQSGNLLNDDNTLRPVSDVLSYNRSPRLSAELGYRLGIGRNTSLDFGILYRNSSNAFSQSSFNVDTQSVGGRFRVRRRF